MKGDTVILFNPLPGDTKGHKGAPLSLLAVAAPLDKKGYKVKIIDANVDDGYIEKALSFLDDSICIGITCMTGPQIKGALEMAKSVKKHRPDIKVVFGGWHATILPEETLENDAIDIVVRGQGEDTFEELVEKLKHDKPIDDIKGLSCKREGRIFSNDARGIKDINETYEMPYHLLDDIEKYITCDWYGDRVLSYISSFGCPHSCGFCAEHNMSHGRWKGLNAARVANEVNALVERYNLDGIALYDSNFFVDEKRVREISKGMKKKIKWGNANGSARILLRYSDETWELMEKNGFSEILIGAESGDNEILEFISKGAKAEDVVKLKEMAHAHNIKLWVSLMLGIPFDLKDPKRSLKREFNACTGLVNKLYRFDNMDRYALFLYTPYPGTLLYDHSLKNGVEVPKRLEDWSRFNLNNVNIPWIYQAHFSAADFLGNFIFANSRPPGERGKEFRRQGRIKKAYLWVCYFIASGRIRMNFYGLRLEYGLIRSLKYLRGLIKKRPRTV